MYGFHSTFESVEFAYNIQMRVSADYAHRANVLRAAGRVAGADYLAAIADRCYAESRDLAALKRDILAVWTLEANNRARREG